MRTYKIYLIRHGVIQANIDGRYIGVTDEDLCEYGINQLNELSTNYEYPNVGKVYSSPLKRCINSAKIIYPEMNVQTVDNLIEYNFGEYENQTIRDLLKSERYLEFIENNKKPDHKELVVNCYNEDGTETMPHFNHRVFTALDEIIKDMMKNKISESAVFAHAGVIMTLLSMCGLPKLKADEWKIENGKGYTLVVNAALWSNASQVEVYTPVPYEKAKV